MYKQSLICLNCFKKDLNKNHICEIESSTGVISVPKFLISIIFEFEKKGYYIKDVTTNSSIFSDLKILAIDFLNNYYFSLFKNEILKYNQEIKMLYFYIPPFINTVKEQLLLNKRINILNTFVMQLPDLHKIITSKKYIIRKHIND